MCDIGQTRGVRPAWGGRVGHQRGGHLSYGTGTGDGRGKVVAPFRLQQRVVGGTFGHPEAAVGQVRAQVEEVRFHRDGPRGQAQAQVLGLAEHVRAVGRRGAAQPAGELPGCGAQSLLVFRRQDQQLRPGGHWCGLGRFVGLDHQAGVRAATAEGADQRSASGGVVTGRSGPGLERLLYLERDAAEVDLRVAVGGVERWRQGVVPELEKYLGQSGDSGRGLEVADVGLHRADRDGPPVGVARGIGAHTEGLSESGYLDRVTEWGTRTMRLHVADGLRLHVGAAERAADHLGLRRGTGHGVTAGLATGVDGRASDDAQDAVAVGERVGQRSEQHRSDALTVDEAVGAGAEALQPVVVREHPPVGERP